MNSSFFLSRIEFGDCSKQWNPIQLHHQSKAHMYQDDNPTFIETLTIFVIRPLNEDINKRSR
ncbi:CLUMA_CG005472, isoform A [Clunio marinus]|uniref:CLUMA_CG005472, isoform A n=1 Tax=Clunio marinus TaxID=568069 RepID=A0A1J1HV21_9DIPT|nr:CLUMA_CG005472, isoform A [Clunio marinus]